MSEGPSGMTVRDVMRSPVVSITPETRFKDAAGRLRSSGLSALPVLDEAGLVIGMLSEADLLARLERPLPAWAETRSYRSRQRQARWAGTVAGQLMSRPAITVGPDATLADAARLMHHHGLKRLPVVDGCGRPVGVVSRGDLLTVFLRSDQAIREEVSGRLESPGFTAVVEDGVVTLLHDAEIQDGRVRRAAEIAAGVDGVVAVSSACRTPGTGPHSSADQEV